MDFALGVGSPATEDLSIGDLVARTLAGNLTVGIQVAGTQAARPQDRLGSLHPASVRLAPNVAGPPIAKLQHLAGYAPDERPQFVPGLIASPFVRQGLPPSDQQVADAATQPST